MGSAQGTVVCVTGASGYIASWLVKLLLHRGYTVKATVRDPSDPKKTQHLLALEGAKERLQLFKADLLDQGSFDSVVDGCVGVFHTATPVSFSYADPEADVIAPAVNGTLNVLQSCAKAASVKRVVVTSSMATVVFHGKALTPDVVLDETWYSDPDVCRQLKLWYMLSKTLAEQAAWKFAKEKGMELVTLNPAVVLGPLLQPTLNASVELILNIIKGVPMFLATSLRYVDVRDVAYAHVYAFEVPSASGRYCLSGRAVHNAEVLEILHHLYPSLFPKCEDVKGEEDTYHVSNEKAKGLGVTFMPLEETIRDTIESLKEKNLLTI